MDSCFRRNDGIGIYSIKTNSYIQASNGLLGCGDSYPPVVAPPPVSIFRRLNRLSVPWHSSRVILVFGLMLVQLAACGERAPVPYIEARPLMGTLVEITVEGPDRPVSQAASESAFAEMQRLTAMMSHYDPASVVSAISAQAGMAPVPVPPELFEVLTAAKTLAEHTGGAFDPTIGAIQGWRFDPQQPAAPDAARLAAMARKVDFRKLILDRDQQTAYLSAAGMRLDLGGIAKLYILHAGMLRLTMPGISRAMVNGGGDVEVSSADPKRPWRIGIRDPQNPEAPLATLDLIRGFVVSSGDYERAYVKDGRRYHHILDPRTGKPTVGPHQVTLVGEDLQPINGLSAAVMVLGRARGLALIQATAGVEGLIIDRDGECWVSPSLRSRLQFSDPGSRPCSH